MAARVPPMGDVAQIGVVGAGFMGSGIAESAARAGVAVKLYEPQAAALEHSRSSIEGSVARAVKRERLTADEGAALLGRIEWSTDLDALAESELVVEAIVEDAAVKAKTFKDLDAAVRPERDPRVEHLVDPDRRARGRRPGAAIASWGCTSSRRSR